MYDSPPTLRYGEDTILEVVQSNAVAQSVVGVGIISDGIKSPPKGDVIPMRFTSSTAVVAFTWSDIVITFETSPPQGMYSVIGCEVQSATGLGFQLKFDDIDFRPGGLMVTDVNFRTYRRQYAGGLGEWGKFNALAPPRVRIFAGAADAAFEGYFHCVKVA
jgi:hypothetical protein